MTKNNKKYSLIFYKEVIFTLLALLSLALLAYEHFFHPSSAAIHKIDRFDFWIAVIFLTDFTVSLANSKDKKSYFKRNWYLLLASIPLADGWAETLRALRLLKLLKLIRAGEHLNYSVNSGKQAKYHK